MVHGGWRVSGPPAEGVHHRWPVERDGKTASLTYFPYGVAISHALVYAAVVLGLSCVAFSKRDF
jgi:hypothetical protein